MAAFLYRNNKVFTFGQAVRALILFCFGLLLSGLPHSALAYRHYGYYHHAVAPAPMNAAARQQWLLRWRKQHPAAIQKAEGGKQKAETANKSAKPAPNPASLPIAHNAPAPSAPSVETRDTSLAGTVATQTRLDISEMTETKADVSRTQDSPFAALGNSWKMLAYLVPMLLLVVGGLRLLQRFQQKTGRLPALLQNASERTGGHPLLTSARRTSPTSPRPGLINAIIGGFHLNNARQQGGSSIRILESVPLGGANLHLIEVRGKQLLLGATSGGINVLTEFKEQESAEGGNFHSLLNAAAADLDSLDLAEPDLPATALVDSIEDVMRDTRDSLTRRARRLRTVQEEEACLAQE